MRGWDSLRFYTPTRWIAMARSYSNFNFVNFLTTYIYE